MEQKTLLNLIQQYNSTDRQTIKTNLKIIMIKYSFSNRDIIEQLNYKAGKVNPWTNMTSPNIPTLENALLLAETFKFNITDLLQPLDT